MKRHPIRFHYCPLSNSFTVSSTSARITSSSTNYCTRIVFYDVGAWGRWRERRRVRVGVDCAWGEWLKHMKDEADLMSLLLKFPAVGS
ncbi:hypothetical protein AKJ16_DCAP01315 [Drosera capensis]